MSELEQIRVRINDCKTYNFGMRNADKLAHEDAPRLLLALEAVLERCANFDEDAALASGDEERRSFHASILRSAISAALIK